MRGHFYAVMREAIRKKQQVVCVYDGLERHVCPHVIGMKNGDEKVLTFQFAGDSSKGLPPGGEWRCLFIGRVTAAEARDGQWHTADSHGRPQTCVDEIDVEVDY